MSLARREGESRYGEWDLLRVGEEAGPGLRGSDILLQEEEC